MQMMYETIYKALVEMGLEGAFSPQDYLNFFCLGNREALDGNEDLSAGSPHAANTPQVQVSIFARRVSILVSRIKILVLSQLTKLNGPDFRFLHLMFNSISWFSILSPLEFL